MLWFLKSGGTVGLGEMRKENREKKSSCPFEAALGVKRVTQEETHLEGKLDGGQY